MKKKTTKKILKFTKIVTFNIIIALYLSELLVSIFFQPKVNMYLGLDYLRYEKSKKLNIEFDTRTHYQAFFEEKKKNSDISPKYRFAKFHFTKDVGSSNLIQDFIESKLLNENLIPFRGPINKKTLSCNEDGKRKIVNNDKNGFKNPNSIYQKKIKILIIGDSFAEGDCQNEKKDIAGIFRNKFKINTANYGIGGAGPLLSLATLKEYGSYYKPNLVIYFYYEGNDMQDLKEEKETFLINYLGNFSQNLIYKNKEIKKFLNQYEDLAYEVYKKEINTYNKYEKNLEQNIKKIKEKEKIEIIKDFFELQKIKNLIFSKSFFGKKNVIDEKLFTDVLIKMNKEVVSWNGKFVIVYLPAWNRFYQKYSFVNFFHKKGIENIIKPLDITYIDMVKEFEKKPDPLNYYPFGLFGHYNAEGYQLVAENLFKKINIPK